ncbi:MAG TPA: HupE/UreJ family protein, partial [Candidatus Competibacter sp.]|nr:HupE/UreJ family protein [Candidatus Competibacter sp.]
MSALLAHVSADHGFAAGLLHPLTGLDHLLAMVAVGLFAARAAGPKLAPATFVLAMALGAGETTDMRMTA